jgi:hypothetical protein
MYLFFHRVLRLGALLTLALLLTPVLSHEVEISDDVAATLHIEPNDQLKAGVPSKTWFALTRKGGQIIPLSQCNCQLAVYTMPQKSGQAPLLKPALNALNAEKYQGIPGATLTFPKPGLYQLELTGTAKSNATFRPFKLKYSVTVAQ